VVLFGIGSPIVVEYVETCRRLEWSILAAVRNRDGEIYFEDHSRIVDSAAVDSTISANPCLCPLFTPANRALATREAQILGFRFGVAMIDPHAIIAATTSVGGGSFVNAGCVLGAEGSISSHALINRGASIGHHVQIGEFVSIGPGAIVGGLARIERGVMIGAGAILLPKTRVGAFAVVGAGAVVTRDVPPRAKVVGNPAQAIAMNLPDFELPDLCS
jgi:sugar O-acyltransferase (sialic acid O-acetyltransferase NeuD family)